MQCDLPGELIDTRAYCPQGSDFSNNKNLQNLLILTAIRLPETHKEKVSEYINRLDNFDGPGIAEVAESDEHQLYEEALTIYIKFEEQLPAINVLVNKIKDMDRAKEFAERVNLPPVWSTLGKAYLATDMVADSVQAFMKANDSADYHEVIAAERAITTRIWCLT